MSTTTSSKPLSGSVTPIAALYIPTAEMHQDPRRPDSVSGSIVPTFRAHAESRRTESILIHKATSLEEPFCQQQQPEFRRNLAKPILSIPVKRMCAGPELELVAAALLRIIRKPCKAGPVSFHVKARSPGDQLSCLTRRT